MRNTHKTSFKMEKKLEALPLKLRKKQFALSPLLLNIFLEALDETARKERKIKGRKL